MDWFAIATSLARGCHVAASLSLFGCLVFRGFVVPPSVVEPPGFVEPPRVVEPAGVVALRSVVAGSPSAVAIRVGLISAWLALAFGGVWLAAVSAAIAGADNLGTAFDAMPTVARHTSFGNVLCLRLLLLAGVLALLSRQHRAARTAALLASGAALGLQPLLGHIGALEGGARAVLIPIEIAHLLAAGAWLGGLSPLLLCVVRVPPRLAATLCERFTPVGLVSVGTIAVTALPQAGELIGGLPGLFGTQYGHFALLKLGLFFLALGLACVNRLLLTARLGTARHGLARRWLIGSIVIEGGIGLCVVLAAAAMASSAPAAHVQPVWPFPWRLSTVAWEEPELRDELIRLLIAGAIGLALIGGSLALRRFRVLAIGLAAIVVVPFLPALALLLVEAYPTSYARSSTGFSVDAIVSGQALYGDHCAVCHDLENGRGSAADLLAPHIWGHLDGELFWWISNGVTDAEGNALMPAFASVLSEDDRWALIDFIHARNVGRQAAATGRWSPPVPAPATPLSCADSDAGALADLGTHMLIVVAAGAPAGIAPAPGSASGTVTVRLVHGAPQTPAGGECVAAAPTAWEAWRVLAGVAPERFGGYRAIVDGQGWLRAWLPPSAGVEQLLAAIRDARLHPIAAGARPDVGHHH